MWLYNKIKKSKGDMIMAHQVSWSRNVLEFFIKEALLNSFEEEIMRTRVQGMTIQEQATKLCCSKSKIEKTIALLKKKYDNVQKIFPDKLPVRQTSAKEVYMDSH